LFWGGVSGKFFSKTSQGKKVALTIEGGKKKRKKREKKW